MNVFSGMVYPQTSIHLLAVMSAPCVKFANLMCKIDGEGSDIGGRADARVIANALNINRDFREMIAMSTDDVSADTN